MNKINSNLEIEVKFLEIDKEAVIKKLKNLGAEDLGEDLLIETIFYDQDLVWQKQNTNLLRVRETKKGAWVTYKERGDAKYSTEFEFKADNAQTVKTILTKLGFIPFRTQEKKRHKFLLAEVSVDIDTWPNVPTYLEIEGRSEKDIKKVAELLDFKWDDAVLDSSRAVIENRYQIPISSYKFFTFKKIAYNKVA